MEKREIKVYINMNHIFEQAEIRDSDDFNRTKSFEKLCGMIEKHIPEYEFEFEHSIYFIDDFHIDSKNHEDYSNLDERIQKLISGYDYFVKN